MAGVFQAKLENTKQAFPSPTVLLGPRGYGGNGRW